MLRLGVMLVAESNSSWNSLTVGKIYGLGAVLLDDRLLAGALRWFRGWIQVSGFEFLSV